MIVLLLAACNDQGLHTLNKDVTDAAPAISVTPEQLDFWSVGGEESTSLPLTVWSVGDTTLRIESIAIEGATSFSLPDTDPTFEVYPGESRVVTVAFAPVEPGDQTGEVVITSDDPDLPVVRVPLSGSGQVPYLVITPAEHDFGALSLGCTDTVTLTLQNVGSDDLDVESWEYAGDGYTLEGERTPPFTLAPYAYTSATVTFAPLTGGESIGALSVSSNDPRGVVGAEQRGDGDMGGTGLDTFETEADPPVDVMFVVDRSTSMDDDAAALGASFSSFIDTVGAVTSGWHLGVATLDDGCLNGGVLDASTTDLSSAFSDAVALGEDRDITHDEALFQIAEAALNETAAGGCNEDFLRDGALLHLVFVSDEPERSTDDAAVWTWDWFVGRWQAAVAAPALLAVSGVVDTEGCNEGDAGYAEAIDATGGEAVSICSADWSAGLAAIAGRSVAYAWTFALTADPVPGSIAVSVDGVPWTDWTYDTELNAVVLDGMAAGGTVEVGYELATTCP